MICESCDGFVPNSMHVVMDLYQTICMMIKLTMYHIDFLVIAINDINGSSISVLQILILVTRTLAWMATRFNSIKHNTS